jgi:hypothetical protein
MKDRTKCERLELVLLRHGESVWGKENVLTGCGLKEHRSTFDVESTSTLKCVIRTLLLLLD